MEYRRRRRTRRKSVSRGRTRASNEPNGGKFILIILVVSAIIYLISISEAGTWLSENIVAPITKSFGKSDKKDDDKEDNTDAENSEDVSAPTETKELTLEKVNAYFLQMGVYNSLDNADEEAKLIKAQGAGGYILKDGDRFRVIATGYSSEDDAKDVCARLKESGMDCTIYKLNTDEVTFRVTASKEQLARIEKTFAALNKAQKTLSEEVISFDKEKKDVSDEIKVVKSLVDELKEAKSDISPYKENKAVSYMVDALDASIEVLESTISDESKSFVEFSSLLKYAHTCVTHEYFLLASNLKG